MKHILAHDGRSDVLPFLHDLTIAEHRGRIYIAWYNSTDAEICGSSLIRGRWTDDGGETWSEPYTIVGKIDSAEEHFVPANLWANPVDGKLRAVITEMSGKNMTMALWLFELEDSVSDYGRSWRRVGQIQHGFLCNTAPIRLDNGTWIAPAWMPMKNGTPAFPAVLVVRDNAVEGEWEAVLLYDPLNPASPRIRCPEITLRVDGSRVTAFVRNDQGPAWIFTSGDYGRTWDRGRYTSMAIGNSKIFAGELSDGRKYLIYNEDRGYFVRTKLVVAIAERGETDPEKYTEVHTLFEDVDPEIGRGSKWFYPCAVESGGYLWVACTLQEPTDERSAVIARLKV